VGLTKTKLSSKLSKAYTQAKDIKIINLNRTFEPLTYNEIQILRYALFPEVRVNQLRVGKEKEAIKTLYLRQE